MSLLRQRDPRIILAACGLSSAGDSIALIVLIVRVKELTGDSPLGVAALLFTMVLPGIVLAPVAGWLVDHLETRRVLIVVSLIQALIAVALGVTDNLVATFALAFALGAGVAVSRPAVFALLPRIAGGRGLTELNAWYQMVYFAGFSFGPVAAGFLLASFGARVALLIDSVSFLILAAGALALHARRPPAEAGAGGHGPGWRQGISVITGDRVVLIVVVVTAFAILLAGATNVAEVFLAKDELDAGDIGYGFLNASWMAGIVLTITTIARRLKPDQLVPGLLVGVAVGSAMTIAAGVAPGIGIAVAAYLIGGGGNGVANVSLRSAIQHRVPEHQLGRAFASFGGLASTADISSSALGGVLIQTLGTRPSIVLLGAAGLLAAGAGALGYLRLPAAARRMGRPADVPAPAGPAVGDLAPPAATASGPGPTPDSVNRTVGDQVQQTPRLPPEPQAPSER